MMNAITWQLLAILLVAALLGFLIGWSVMRLRQAQQLKAAISERMAAEARLSNKVEQLNLEKAGLVQALDAEKNQASKWHEEQSRLVAQQETLQVHANLQAQRIDKLSAQLHVSEEKSIRLQRDFASFKANKLREVRMLKVSADEWLDNEELPVLNKKVEQGSMKDHNQSEQFEPDDMQADLDQTQPIIASELDIPSLSESELPDSVEELEFELVEYDEPT